MTNRLSAKRRGRPRKDPLYRRVFIGFKVHPHTVFRIKVIAKASRKSYGEVIDMLTEKACARRIP